MLFHDQATARSLRREAYEDLTSWLTAILVTLNKHRDTEYTPEILHDFAVTSIQRELPALVRTFINSSAYIFPNTNRPDETPHYPAILYFDNEAERTDAPTIARAIRETPHAMAGGLFKGSLNT